MGNWKKEYEEIKVPENMKERMEASIARAKKDKRKVKKVKLWPSSFSTRLISCRAFPGCGTICSALDTITTSKDLSA